MADAPIEKKYTKVPNDLLEAFSRTKFTNYQVSILFALLRKTYGWRKEEDQITLEQLSEITRIDRRNISKPLQELQNMGVVKARKKSPYKIYYSIQRDIEKWRIDMRPHVKRDVSNDMQPEQNDMAPNDKFDMSQHAHKRNKEKNKRERGVPPSNFFKEIHQVLNRADSSCTPQKEHKTHLSAKPVL